MSRIAAIIGGGVAGAMALIGILVLLLWLCNFHKRNGSRGSENGSSDPAIQVESNVGSFVRESKCFGIEELSLASKNFSSKSLIGQGMFGEVYMGLLNDGMLVAIKRRYGRPSQEFVQEARYLSSIQHRNLVTLLGYCQENDFQFLVYEYVSNGSVSSHLYGGGREKLELKHRVSIALGAAKGLAHVHSLSPRLLHKDFKTANVLVDENFVAKVADAGIGNFITDTAGPSSEMIRDLTFQAPEVREFRSYSEKSDVYSFGVFLVELVRGREAMANLDLVEESTGIESRGILGGGGLKSEGSMEKLVEVMRGCCEVGIDGRLAMGDVVRVLDGIVEREMMIGEEGMPTVTPGSHLFEQSKYQIQS